MLRKSSQRTWRLEIPQLYRVVPARAEEAVPVNEVPIHAVDLVPVLLEGANGIHVRRRGDVPDLDAPVPARRGEDVLVRLAPRAVVQPVDRVERRDLAKALRCDLHKTEGEGLAIGRGRWREGCD